MCLALIFAAFVGSVVSLSKRRRINLIDFPRRLCWFCYTLFRCWRIFCLISFAVCGTSTCLLPFPFLVRQYRFVCKIMIRASTNLQYVGNHHRVLCSHFYPLLCVIVIRNGTSKLLFRKLFEQPHWIFRKMKEEKNILARQQQLQQQSRERKKREKPLWLIARMSDVSLPSTESLALLMYHSQSNSEMLPTLIVAYKRIRTLNA